MENILKMIYRRGLIESWEDEYSKIKEEINKNNTIFEIKSIKYSINLLDGKIASIVQGTPLDDYLSSNVDIHKIIVSKDVSKKVVKQIVSDYINTEFFFEHEMMEDIPSKVFIPKHELLLNDEKEELLSKFSENELSRIYITDIMSRYYNAKVGDIFRIIRPSTLCGINVFYRKVVNSSWDLLFD